MLLKGLVLSGVAAAFNMAKAGRAAAAKKTKASAKAAVKKCHSGFDDCIGGCPSVGGSQAYDPNNECHVDCGFKEYECLTSARTSGQQSPQDGGGAQQPGGVTSQPKGKGLRDPVNVGPISQPEGGSSGPKGKGIREPINVSPVNQPGGGSTSPPKGKVGLGQVNVQGLGSGQTSGGTTTIQRSRGGKKH